MSRGRFGVAVLCAVACSHACTAPEPIVAFRASAPRRIVVLPAESEAAMAPLTSAFDRLAHGILQARGYSAVPAEVAARVLSEPIARDEALTMLLDTFAADAVMVQKVIARSSLGGADPRDAEIEWTIVAGRPPLPIWSSRLRLRSAVLTTDRVSGPPDIAGFEDPSAGAASGSHSRPRALDLIESVEEVLARMSTRLPRASSRQ